MLTLTGTPGGTGDYFIDGDNNGQVVTVTTAPDGTSIRFQETGGSTIDVPGNRVNIFVQLYDGADDIRIATNIPNAATRYFYVDGGAGNDWIEGGDGPDDIYGGPGNDIIFGRLGGDYISGDDDWDLVTYEDHVNGPVNASLDNVQNDGYADESPLIPGTQRDYLDSTVEELRGGPLDDTISGNGSSNILAGIGGNDSIDAGGGADTLYGGDGDDDLWGGGLNDVIDGGAGVDFTYYDDSLVHGSRVVVTVGVGADDGISGENDFIESNVEGVVGTNYNDDITLGDVVRGYVYGRGGDDLIKGGYQGDYLYGEAGNDKMYGYGNNDLFDGGDGDRDEVSYLIPGYTAVTVTFDGQYNDGQQVPLTGPFLPGDPTTASEADNVMDNIEIIVGSDASDNISADGESGRKIFDGRAGDDSLTGGLGNDEIYGSIGLDTIVGGNGNDLIVGGGDNDNLYGGYGDDWIWGDDLYDYGDTAGTPYGADYLEGGFGHDYMIGGPGADVFQAQDGGAVDDLWLRSGDTAAVDSSDILHF